MATDKTPTPAPTKDEDGGDTQTPSRARRWARDLLFLAFIAFVSMAARSVLADHYHVPSGSMLPTIEIGDRLLVNKLAYGVRLPFSKLYVFENRGPQRGDVVVLRSPEDGVVLLKRVAAVPGDQVEVVRGRLVLNGEDIEIDEKLRPWREHLGESPAHPIQITGAGGPRFGPITIPERQYLVLGDNRGQSRDGRMFGLVNRKLFLGRGIVVYRSNGQFVWHKLH